MNKKGSKKSYIVLIILLLLAVTIGYAALNSTLNINGRSNISKNTWDIHFDNVTVKDGSVEAIKLPTIENNTTVNFEVELELPGDFYEFTVDVVNNGTIDAMIDNIEKTPDLSTEQQKYLNYIIEYQNEEQITTKQLVKSNEFVKIKVRVEYIKDISASDLPKNTETLNLGFNVNYVQADESGITVTDNGVYYPIKIISGDYNTVGSEIAIGNEHFYVISSDEDSVTMLTKYNLYVGGECSLGTCIPYGNEATGKQDESMLGYIINQTVGKGITVFSSTEQKGINYSDYNGSIVEGYVNNYKKILESDYKVNVVEARLITYEELINLGCDEFTCNSAPSFISLTTYWSGTASGNNTIYVISNGYIFNNNYLGDDSFGVRPVIVINKNQIKIEEKQKIEFMIDAVSYQAEEGMTWEEWVNSEYNINGYFINSTFVFQFEAAFVTSDGFMSVNPSDIIDPRINYIVNDKSSN